MAAIYEWQTLGRPKHQENCHITTRYMDIDNLIEDSYERKHILHLYFITYFVPLELTALWQRIHVDML